MEKNGLRGRRRKTDMQKKTDTEKGGGRQTGRNLYTERWRKMAKDSQAE